MKFRFNRQEAADALGAICTVTSVRTPKETLRCVRMEAKPDVLLLSATDLELSLRYAVGQVDVESPGVALVVADTLARIVRECEDEVLSIEIADRKMHVRGLGSHFQIVTQDPEEFPPVPVIEGEPDITVEHGLLRRLIELTMFAAARESTRYAINGVLWEVEGDKLTLAATDGRRLAVANGALKSGSKGGKKGKEPRRAIVPTKALSLFLRLPAEPETPVSVKFMDSQILLDLGRATMGTALVEGQFPRYQDVIPTDCDWHARMSAHEFTSALKRASLLTNEESKGVRFAFERDTLTLSSRAPEQGEATISMPVEYGGEPLTIGFNPVFLLDVLRVAHAEEISFALKEANRPGLMRLGDDFVYVVMPVNLSSA